MNSFSLATSHQESVSLNGHRSILLSSFVYQGAHLFFSSFLLEFSIHKKTMRCHFDTCNAAQVFVLYRIVPMSQYFIPNTRKAFFWSNTCNLISWWGISIHFVRGSARWTSAYLSNVVYWHEIFVFLNKVSRKDRDIWNKSGWSSMLICIPILIWFLLKHWQIQIFVLLTRQTGEKSLRMHIFLNNISPPQFRKSSIVRVFCFEGSAIIFHEVNELIKIILILCAMFSPSSSAF